MAVRIEKEERRVIPNWRSFMTTAYLGELDSIKQKKSSNANLSIDSYILDFNNNKTVTYAADLLSASIVNGFEERAEVKEAAGFILEHESDSTSALTTLAKTIIEGRHTQKNIQFENITIKDLSNSIIETDYQAKIHNLKVYLRNRSINPIAWVELSRCYAILGQSDQAIFSMKVAMQLAPNNRYVTRCAVRLFSHYKNLELAHYVLKKNIATQYDPWLASAEISIELMLGKSSNIMKKGIALVESNNFSPFMITELTGAIATTELLNGNRKKSRKMFRKSLVSPNDNSLAQIEWILNSKDKDLLDRSEIKVTTKRNYEALAISNFYRKDLVEALNNTCQWFCDMPYSKRPVLLGSGIADFLDNRQLAIDFLKKGLIAHEGDAQMINNIAYYLSMDGDTINARKYLSMANMIGVSKNTEICLLATKGLICFREKRYEEGRKLYMKAIQDTLTERNKELNWTAILNYAREEILAKSNQIETIMSIVAQIPKGEDNDISIKKLQVEVEKLYLDYKNNK